MRDKALVIGAGGFLGGWVSREFDRAGWAVVGLDARPGGPWRAMTLPSPELGPLLGKEQPRLVVHAGGTATPGLSLAEPAADFQANVVATFDLLDQIRRHSPAARLVLLSSAAVYGQPDKLPIGEGAPCRPLSPYGCHKRQAELLCAEFSALYGLATVVLRIFSAYGEGLKRQVVWDICRQLAAGVEELTLQGTGAESRDFIHAQDVARAVRLAGLEAPGRAEAYNLAGGAETTIAELAQRLAALAGRQIGRAHV
jgi:UDP-glucose 4-epimerase